MLNPHGYVSLGPYLCITVVVPANTDFNKSGGPVGHQVRILRGPAEIYTLPVRMSDTIFSNTKQIFLASKSSVFRVFIGSIILCQ